MDNTNQLSLRNTASAFFDAARRHSRPAQKHWVRMSSAMAATVALSLLPIHGSAEPIPRTQIKSFDAPGAGQTWPEDINNSLTIIGQSYGAENTSFVYRNGVRETTTPGYTYLGNNDKGQIVGIKNPEVPGTGSNWNSFVKTDGDVVEGSGSIIPTDINNHGTTVGRANDWHAFVLKDNELTFFLEEFEDEEDEGGIHTTSANGINDSDIIVGSYLDYENNESGFIYDIRIASYESVNHPSGENTRLNKINNWGLIVGNHYPGDETSQGFAYFDGKFIPVEIGKLSTTVTGVNDWGFITGSYRDSWEDKEHAYIAHILPFILWDEINSP